MVMKTCHICGALIENGRCQSCGHVQCSGCPDYVEKPSWDELHDEVTRLQRARIGDSEVIGRHLCTIDRLHTEITTLRNTPPRRYWSKPDLWRLQRDLDQDRAERRAAAIRHADFRTREILYADARVPFSEILRARAALNLCGLLRAFWLEGHL